CMQPLEFPFTF
nr:immunoglobulin light chain junction region [Macaca mulatta]MOX08171.1 immunoglobulin light chain junction region [Macaca mulatta]